ncbi:MAG TPA: BatD family protein, partial [Myxococcaceae bacterium]|nr:BatD family protein [Myxococcaceae bacterium]
MISRRTGRAALLLAGLLGLAGSAFAEARLAQTVDRSEVGTEDVFTVTITVAGAAGQARLELPESDDFEVLGRSQSTQVSIAGGGMQRLQRYTLRLRANRAGRLILPGAVLTQDGHQIRAEPLEITAKPGHVARGSQPDEPDPTDPFAGMGFPSLPGFPN